MAVSESNVCAVLQCPLSKPSHGVSDVWYFDVPPVTDPKYSRWIEILSKGRDSQWSPTPSTKVCSRHFSTGTVLPTPADQSGKRGKRLKKGACPYVVDAEVMVAESRISTSDPLASPSTSASTSVLVSDNGETGPPAKKQRVDAVDPSIPEKPIEDTNSLPPVLPTQSVDAINNPTPVPTIQCALPPPAPPIQPVQEPSPCQLGLAPKLPKLAPKKPGLSAARQPSTSASLPASPLSMVPANPADEPATSGGDTAVEACCVPGCTISSANAMAQAVTLHAFRPSTHPFYETWTQRLRCAATWTPKSTDVICSQHFEPGDFLHHDVNTGELLAQRQLKDDAMPSHLAGIIDFHYSGVYTRHEDVSGIMQCMVCHASRKPGQTKPSERLKFYPFPTGANTRRGWMNFLKQNGRVQVVTDRSLVCENHFTPDDYALGPTSGVLKSRAVPSWTLRIQLQYPPPTVKSDSEIGCTAMCKSEEIRSIKSPIISAQNVTARTDGVLEDGQNLVAKNLERVTPLTDMDVRVSREDPGLRPIDDNVTTVEASATTQEIPLLEEKNNADNELSSTSGSSSVAAHPVPVEEQCSKSAVSSEKSATDCASFYCEKCKISLRNPCWLHAVSFPDEPTTPLAISSLPKNLSIDLCHDSPTGKAVFAKELVPPHIVFGPLIAPLTTGDDGQARYFSVIDALRKHYELQSDYTCNWMKHVRFAKGAEESNLLVFARGPEIVFVTKKAIQPKEELTVWYSEQYNEAVTAPASAALNLRSDPGKKADKMTSTDEDTEEPSSAAKRKADGYDITTQNVYIPVISAEFGPSVPVGIEDGFGYVEEVVVEPVRGRPDPAPAVKNSVSPQKESSKENRLNSSAVIQPSPSNIGSGGGGNLTSGADVENTAKTRERANKCLFCNTSFEDRRKLNIHVIMHGGRDGFRCGVCEEKFAYYGLLAAHFKKHGSEEIATSSLQILTAAAAASSSPTKKKRLSKQDSLDMHFLSHATGSVCTCDECTKPAKSPERNGSHRNSSTSSGRKTHELLNNLFSEYPEDVEDEADLSMSDLEGEYSDSDGFDDSLFEDQEMEDDSAQWQHHKLAGFHKGNKSGGNHLWEFIRDLLKDPRCNPTIIRWDDKKAGIFRIVKSKAVADKWGARKCNPRMNYEKLSRAMRHYYKTEFILPVLGRRLVYKFGPKATGWQD